MEAQAVRLTYGSWYQRTTLHLSEMYEFLRSGQSKLPLDKRKLQTLHEALGITQVTREPGNLEYIHAITKDGFELHYYEDGLFTLGLESTSISSDKQKLTDFYNNVLSPAVAYIFSLGAPTPKELANISTNHPLVASVSTTKPEQYEPVGELATESYETITSPDCVVKKSLDLILIIVKPASHKHVQQLAEAQIFFREFKDQLEKYLDIHRLIWEKIETIKERRYLRGNQLEKVRSELDTYQRTISLITNRINQMDNYLGTRQSLCEKLGIEQDLRELFQYRFESLQDTLNYIKEIWTMTNDYLNSAIQIIVELKNQTTNASIESLRTITTIGVISSIIAYLAQDKLPSITSIGVQYFTLLIVVAFILNSLISLYSHFRRYQVSLPQTGIGTDH